MSMRSKEFIMDSHFLLHKGCVAGLSTTVNHKHARTIDTPGRRGSNSALERKAPRRPARELRYHVGIPERVVPPLRTGNGERVLACAGPQQPERHESQWR